MNLPSDTPRLPKWIFLTGDAALLATAWIIYDQSGRPFTGLPLLMFAACVITAGVIGVIPFVADYARRQDEALDDRQRSLQALSVTVAASAEQIAIAATGLQGIAEAAQENLGKSEAVSKAINEKVAELQALLAGSKKEGGDAAARLEAAAKAIAAGVESAASKAAQSAQDSQGKSESHSKQILEKLAELRALQAGARKDEDAAAARLEALAKKLSAAVAALEASASGAHESPHPVIEHVPVLAPEVPPVPPSRIVEIKPAAAPSYSPFDAPPPEPVAHAPEAAAAPAAQAHAAAPEPAPAAPAPRKRSPRKPAAAPAPAPQEAAPEPKPAEPDTQLSPPEVAEPAVSADGATRLVVTAYIGIGNRLFIRGEGPGLSWDRGVPLQFVSIGKWRWETNEATKAVRFKLYKNDDSECSALGERSVEPGAQQELTAVF